MRSDPRFSPSKTRDWMRSPSHPVEVSGEVNAFESDDDVLTRAKKMLDNMLVTLIEMKLKEFGISEVGKTVIIGLDSGAEITLWPPRLCPEVKTEESAESRSGVKYWGPGDLTAQIPT